MLNLNNANRLYTDMEILEKAAKYIYTNGYQDEKLDDAVDMLSKIVDYDPDFIKGFVGRTIQDLTKDKSKQK